MPMAKESNCVNEDCIPFSELSAHTNPALDSGTERGNGGTVHVWSGRHSGPPPFRRTYAFWIQVLLALIAVLMFLVIIFITLWAMQRRNATDEICLEQTCIKAAAEILSNMDQSLSPCDSFYDYACSGWIRNNHIPQGHNNWSILRKLTKTGEHFIKDILENYTIHDTSHALKLAQVYYNSCMDEASIDHRGFQPLYDHLNRYFDGWLLLPQGSPGARSDGGGNLTKDTFNLTHLYFPSLTRFGVSPLLRIGVAPDLKNSSHFLIEFSEAVLCLQRENYVNDTHSAYIKQTEAYRNFMRNYSSKLGVPKSELIQLDHVYEFEKQLAIRMEERSERDPEKNYHVTSLNNLSIICPIMHWDLLVTEVLKPVNLTISPDDPIAFSDWDFFKNRCRLYEEYLSNDTGIKILHNAAVWNFLWRTVSKMPTVVSRLLEEYKEAESGLKIDPARWQTCVTETQATFGMVIGRIFVNQKFDQKSKEAATEMITEIREAFKENFATVEWMQEEDKVKAIEKVDTMKASVGYPPDINDIAKETRVYASIKNMSVDTYLENYLACSEALFRDHMNLLRTMNKDEWELSPHIVNAFYKDNANHIYFPAGILQNPVYDHKHPLSLNFGGIGMVVGHEITHAFDQYGSKRDAQGNLRQWWSNKTREAFERNSQCMIEQYSNYSVLNTSLNGKMTLGENIADNGGIKAAYKAFKKLEAKYSDGPILPGLNFTSDQLFFLSFAQLWCVKHLPRSVLNTVLFDVHTVDQYRVIGTLTNSEDFARVFKCPVGSYMNPEKKCKVW